MLVIEEAYERIPSKMLHRDLSTGNVMLGDPEDDEVGLLGDWDHAFETRSEDGSERKSGRTVRGL